MTNERLGEIRELLRDGSPRGFRAECRELCEAVLELLGHNHEMRSVRFNGEMSAEIVADRCEEVARYCDSSLHEVAALKLRSLIRALAEAEDQLADKFEMTT